MKRYLLALTACWLVAGLSWGSPDYLQWTSEACSTNASNGSTSTYTPDNDLTIYGWFDGIYIDIAGTAATTTVLLATSSDGPIPARTLFTKAISADGWYSVRGSAVGTTGTAITDSNVVLPLMADNVELSLYNTGNTGMTATVYMTYTRAP